MEFFSILARLTLLSFSNDFARVFSLVAFSLCLQDFKEYFVFQDCDNIGPKSTCKGTNFCNSSIEIISLGVLKNNSFLQFCCCTSSFCNHANKLRISSNINLTHFTILSPHLSATTHTTTTTSAAWLLSGKNISV